jgi:hypothetical protein
LGKKIEINKIKEIEQTSCFGFLKTKKNGNNRGKTKEF